MFSWKNEAVERDRQKNISNILVLVIGLCLPMINLLQLMRGNDIMK